MVIHILTYILKYIVHGLCFPCSSISFIQDKTPMNDLLKAALIHFYIAYLHPYFDGNGRMARLLHLWYLVQQGYSSANV